MRFEVLTVMKMLMLVFWVVAALKVEAVCSSETLVSIYKSTWYYYPEDHHQSLCSFSLSMIQTCAHGNF
jgi:hypothetical protein